MLSRIEVLSPNMATGMTMRKERKMSFMVNQLQVEGEMRKLMETDHSRLGGIQGEALAPGVKGHTEG